MSDRGGGTLGANQLSAGDSASVTPPLYMPLDTVYHPAHEDVLTCFCVYHLHRHQSYALFPAGDWDVAGRGGGGG